MGEADKQRVVGWAVHRADRWLEASGVRAAQRHKRHPRSRTWAVILSCSMTSRHFWCSPRVIGMRLSQTLYPRMSAISDMMFRFCCLLFPWLLSCARTRTIVSRYRLLVNGWRMGTALPTIPSPPAASTGGLVVEGDCWHHRAGAAAATVASQHLIYLPR